MLPHTIHCGCRFREISGKNKDSGEHAEIPSYALTGLSRFDKEQLDYV
jgi:hypothetical protein